MPGAYGAPSLRYQISGGILHTEQNSMPILSLASPVTAAGATSMLATINWSKPTWDLFIALSFLLIAFLYGLSLGRDRIMVIMVSIYMALAVIKSAPEAIVIKNVGAIQISAFVGLFLLLFFLLSRSALHKSISFSEAKGPWWQSLVFSVLHVGLLISVILSFLPKEAVVKNLSTTTQNLFVHSPAPFLWVIAPILVMLLTKGKSGERKYKYDL